MAEIEFGTFEAPETVNPYNDTITKLIAAGENASVVLTLTEDEITKERNKLSKAANAQDRTARLRLTEDTEDGAKRLTFTLTAKHKARRRKDAGESAEAVQA